MAYVGQLVKDVGPSPKDANSLLRTCWGKLPNLDKGYMTR